MDKILEYLHANVRMGSDEKYFITNRIIVNTSKLISGLEHLFYTRGALNPVIMHGYIEEAVSNILLLLSSQKIFSKDIKPIPEKVTHKQSISNRILVQTFSGIINNASILLNNIANRYNNYNYDIELLINILEDFHELCLIFSININLMYKAIHKNKEYYFMTASLDYESIIASKKEDKILTEKTVIDPKYSLDIALHPNHSYKKLILLHKLIPLKEFNSGNLITDFFHASSFLKATNKPYFYSPQLYEFLSTTKEIEDGYIIDGKLHRSSEVKDMSTKEFMAKTFHVIITKDIQSLDDLLDYINLNNK